MFLFIFNSFRLQRNTWTVRTADTGGAVLTELANVNQKLWLLLFRNFLYDFIYVRYEYRQ